MRLSFVSRNNWWLSGVASSSYFCNVNNNGNPNYNNANNTNGVRPITDTPRLVGFSVEGDEQ